MRIAIKSIIFAALSTVSCNAQELKEKDVPANLKEAFVKAYPNVKDAEWEKEGGNFEAEFKIKGVEQSVVFDAQGNILETEVEIPEADLPAPAREYISKNYGGTKIKEAARITTPSGIVSYEADIDKKDLIFDGAGKFLKIEEEEKGKDND